MIVCLVLLASLWAATTADANEWVKLAFTAPGDSSSYDHAIHRVARYELRYLDAGTVPGLLPIYEAPNLTSGPPIPSDPGQPDHLFLSLATSNPRPTIFWLIGIGDNGLRSDSSNADVYRLGVPRDTLAFDQVAGRWVRTETLGATGVVHIARPPGDHRWNEARLPGPPWSLVPIIATQEEVQRADRTEICRQFGYWCLRGGAQPCP